MRTYLSVLMLSLVLIFGSIVSAKAEQESKKITTTVFSQFDLASPEDAKDYTQYQLSSYWLYDNQFGVFLEVTAQPERDCNNLLALVSAKINKDALTHFTVGFSTNNLDSDYLFAGAWQFRTMGKWNSFVELRHYFGVDNTSDDFSDVFAEVTYAVSDKISVGVATIYDHWWESNSDWFLIGPIVYYKLMDNAKFFVRASNDWYKTSGDTTQTQKLRLGILWTF